MADDPFRPLGGSRSTASAKSPAEWTVLAPVPKNAPPAPAEHPKLGKPSAIYTYRDARGDLLGHVLRFGPADGGGKQFRPLTYCRSARGELAWYWQSWPERRPLYNLDKLAKRPKAPVIICEGEKAADAAAQLLPGYVVVTSPHGSESAAKADWSPLYRRDVTIWPDNDDAGSKYAETVARLLAPIAGSIKLLEPPKDTKPGWDAADASGERWDQARATAFLATAAKWGAPPRRRRSKASRDHTETGADADGEDSGTADPGRRRRQADELLDFVAEIELWHSPDRDPYATVPVNGHFENWPVRSKGFRLWVTGQYFRRTRRGPSKQALEEAWSTFEAIAINNGAEHTPCLRVGTHGEDI